ncbi:putative PE-PGRS family protein [Nocardioidaceae bacterium Broad-1]|nr:putative PE-PGRS family protein [Nocardioidaceae bacterium Broad-1]
MDQSPKGREIQPLTGDSAVIVARGNKIEELGVQMSEAATVLEQIATGELADGQMQGKAVAELQDKIGSSYETLREASELYTPVGPLIAAYGTSLGELQAKMGPLVDSCTDKWATYEALPGDRETDDEEGRAKETAYNEWHDDAESWDAQYDTWEDAYDLAVNGIGNEMAGSIKDGFWEIFGFLINILEAIAMVFMIAGLFLGGIVAVIGFALGALVLIGKIVQASAGKCEVTDVLLAVLAVLPFGKLGQIGKAWGQLGKGAASGGKTAGAAGRGYGNFALKRAVPLNPPPVNVTFGAKFKTALSISTGFREVPRTRAAWMANPFKPPKDIPVGIMSGSDIATGMAIFGAVRTGTWAQKVGAGFDGLSGLGKWAGEWYGTTSTSQSLNERRTHDQQSAHSSEG